MLTFHTFVVFFALGLDSMLLFVGTQWSVIRKWAIFHLDEYLKVETLTCLSIIFIGLIFATDFVIFQVLLVLLVLV